MGFFNDQALVKLGNVRLLVVFGYVIGTISGAIILYLVASALHWV